MQWLDCEQSEQDKRYVEATGRSARERWQRMVEAEKQEEKQGAAGGNSHSPGDERT